MVVEGVHVVPGGVHPRVREHCVLVEALLVVEDADLHRAHFGLRPGTRPAERYLARFDEIRASRTTSGRGRARRAWRSSTTCRSTRRWPV